MELNIDVREALKELKHLTEHASKEVLTKSISQSINNTLAIQRTAIARSVRKDYNIPKNYADTIGVFKSNKNTLTGYIEAGSKPISLANFNPKFIGAGKSISNKFNRKEKKLNQTVKSSIKSSIGVSVTIRNTSTIPYAFMIPGKFPVFARGQYKSNPNFGFVRRFGQGSRITKSGMDTPIAKLISVTAKGAAFNKRTINGISINTKKVFNTKMVSNMKFYSGGVIQ